MADISGFGFPDDVRFARHMVEDVGVAVVPGSSFFSRPELGAHLVRFAFCKRLGTLREAGERLRAAFVSSSGPRISAKPRRRRERGLPDADGG